MTPQKFSIIPGKPPPSPASINSDRGGALPFRAGRNTQNSNILHARIAMSSSFGMNFLFHKDLFAEKYAGKILQYFHSVARDQADQETLEKLSREFIQTRINCKDGVIDAFLKAREDEYNKTRHEISFRAFLLSAILEAWKERFCSLYNQAILDQFRIVSQGQADENLLEDLRQDFLMQKIMRPNGLIEHYLQTLETGEATTSENPFQRYLNRSIKFAWISHKRKRDDRAPQARDPENDYAFDEPAAPAAKPDRLDPEVLYAYAFLNRTLIQVRAYCLAKKMERNWVIFSELILGKLDKTRPARTLEELRQTYFPGAEGNQKLHNALTTVKRLFERQLRQNLADFEDTNTTPKQRFEQWMQDLLVSDSFIHGAIEYACQITIEQVEPQSSSAKSDMTAHDRLTSDDEFQLGFIYYLRKSLPIVEWPEWSRIQQILDCIPRNSPFRADQSRLGIRPLSLELLMTPNEAEKRELEQVHIEKLLRQIKDLVKGAHHHEKSSPIEKEFYRTLHTIIITIARVGFNKSITSRTAPDHQKSILELKTSRWIDDETRLWLGQALRARGVWYND